METLVASSIAPLFAFFLAHVLGKYVDFRMNRWRRTRTGTLTDDVLLAQHALRVLGRRVQYRITDDLIAGRTTFREHAIG